MDGSDSHFCAFLNRALRCRRSSLPPWRPKRQARPGRSASLDRERSVSSLEDCSQVPERCLLGWREEFCLFFPLSSSPDPSTPFFHSFLVSAVSAPHRHAHGRPQGAVPSFFLSFHSGSLVLAPFIMPLSIGRRPFHNRAFDDRLLRAHPLHGSDRRSCPKAANSASTSPSLREARDKPAGRTSGCFFFL